MKKLILITALTLFSSTGNAGSGIGGLNRCKVLKDVIAVQETLMSPSRLLALTIKVRRQLFQCNGGNLNDLLTVSTEIHSANGADLPRGGYMDGRFATLDAKGEILEERVLDGSFFVISMYPFQAAEASAIAVEIEGFGSAKIHLH